MITYKPIVIQGGRRKDGTWPVKIRVTFKGQSRRLPTTLVCTDNDLTRSGHIKNATILQQAGELIARMRSTCDALSPFALEGWSVDDVVRNIRDGMTAQQFRLDFFAFADDYITCKTGRTRDAYVTALNALARFLGRRELDINDITKTMLLDFAEYIDAEPRMHWDYKTGGLVPSSKTKIAGGASARHTAKLAHIFAAARFRYNDDDTGRILIPRTPFEGLKKAYPPGKGQEPLEPEVMQAIIDYQPATWLERYARAAFLISFCTMGANLADLWAAKDGFGGVWVYNRKKTANKRQDRAEARVALPEQIAPLLRDLAGQDGAAGWWIGGLHRWRDANAATGMVNKGLRSIAERLGVKPFTFYAARKTWGTLGRRIGIEKATIAEGLTHIGDFKVTDIYAQRNWSLAWDANARVLALFRWPE